MIDTGRIIRTVIDFYVMKLWFLAVKTITLAKVIKGGFSCDFPKMFRTKLRKKEWNIYRYISYPSNCHFRCQFWRHFLINFRVPAFLFNSLLDFWQSCPDWKVRTTPPLTLSLTILFQLLIVLAAVPSDFFFDLLEFVFWQFISYCI